MKPHSNAEKQSLNSQINLESESRLLFQLMKCSHFIERETNNILHRYGLKQQQFAVLNEIIWNGPISQKELCDNLLFEKSNISRIVKLLSEKGFIQVEVDPLDRRLTLLTETPEGGACWKDCLRDFNEASAAYLPSLSIEEVKLIFRQLKQIEKTLNKKRLNATEGYR